MIQNLAARSIVLVLPYLGFQLFVLLFAFKQKNRNM